VYWRREERGERRERVVKHREERGRSMNSRDLGNTT